MGNFFFFTDRKTSKRGGNGGKRLWRSDVFSNRAIKGINRQQKLHSIRIRGILVKLATVDRATTFFSKSFSPNSDDYNLNSYINAANESFNHYSDAENYEQTNTGIDYHEPLRYDLIDFSMEWCDCNNEEECRIFLQTRLPEKQISTGDFNKAMLKIVTVSKELSTICEDIGKIDLLHKLNQIDKMVLKYVTTSQSLYL